MSSGWRRALELYVAGRNRSLSLQEKEASVRDRRKQPVGGTSLSETAAFGVGIPDTLKYSRNAGTWRDRLVSDDKHGRDPGA